MSEIEVTALEGGWLQAFRDLRAHGLHWKKAAFAAWYNAPKSERKPDTQEALAELLNYKSPQVFYKWQKQEWFRELGIDRLREAIMLRHLGDVDRKTIQAALNEDGGPGVQARRLFYEQIIMPKQGVEISGPDGGPVQTKDASLTDEERAERIMALFERARARRAGPAADSPGAGGEGQAEGDDSGSGGGEAADS
jgi:hypothetical protein